MRASHVSVSTEKQAKNREKIVRDKRVHSKINEKVDFTSHGHI